MAERNENNNGIEWWSLILGILFVIASLIAFRNPAASLMAIVVIGGVVAICRGIFLIMSRNRIKERTGKGINGLIVVGVIDIILGIIILTHLGGTLAVLPWIVGFWFIFDGISDIFFSVSFDMFGQGYKVVNIITSIIGIILGVLVLRNPLAGYFTVVFLVGFWFMLAGIRYIVQAFL